MPRPLPLHRLLCLWLLLVAGCGGGGSSDAGGGVSSAGASSRPQNTLLDSDRDGVPDEVRVGDWDGDGTLETHDVQQAIDALKAAGPAPRMTIVVSESGSYRAPTTSPWYQSNGLIALPSHTHLRCLPGVVLEGMAPSAYTGNGDGNSAVINNADAETSGNVDITVEGCTIQGGKDVPYDSLAGAVNRFDGGIAMMGADDVRILDNHVSWTNHACIYSRNVTHALIRNNRMEYCGGYLRSGNASRFPGYYLFVTDSPQAAPSPWAGVRNVTSYIRVEGNTCFRVAGTCFNTRHDTVGAMEYIDWVDNASRESRSVASLKGIVNGSFTGHRSLGDGDGIALGTGATAASSFQSDRPDKESVSGFRIEDVEIRGLTGPHFALSLGGFSEDVSVRGVRVYGTSGAQDCMTFFYPARNLLIEDVVLRDCARHGMVTAAVATPPYEPAFAPVVRDVAISCVDAADPFDDHGGDGWVLNAPFDGMRVERLSIEGVSDDAVRVAAYGLVDQTWTDTTFDMTPCGYDGEFSERLASARRCGPENAGAWMSTTDADFDGDCDFRDGGGPTDSACRCGVAYSGLADGGSGGASLAVSGTTFAPDELVQNAATLVLRPEQPDEERCAIAFHDADSITCDAAWLRPPAPGDAWVAWRWAPLGGVSPVQAAIDLGPVPSLRTTFVRLTVRDPSGVAIDLDGPVHQNLRFEGLRGERNTLGSFGATAVLLDHGDLAIGTTTSDVVCEALAPGRSFAPCVDGTP